MEWKEIATPGIIIVRRYQDKSTQPQKRDIMTTGAMIPQKKIPTILKNVVID